MLWFLTDIRERSEAGLLSVLGYKRSLIHLRSHRLDEPLLTSDEVRIKAQPELVYDLLNGTRTPGRRFCTGEGSVIPDGRTPPSSRRTAC
ncbi:hypothetical protein [Streptomyces agglomeratus]|uniref:hypothetical protein n=1 Tax=Streptomyces agglomeratus TaxID=285458 RepID=UPI00114D2B8C|nr:hypothetical protein [Streptomyces agglomeratus]